MGVWPPLPLRSHLAPLATRRAFPLGERGCRLYAKGRHGLAHGVTALGLGPGDRVLVPAYHHGSEVEALLRKGIEPVFFASDDHLRPVHDALEDLVGPQVRALHLTHYLGFPQDVERYRRWTTERGLLLIEDAAQAFLAQACGRPAGAWGDLALTCLYKAVGVPDGAAVVCRRELPEPARAAWGAAGVLRRHQVWIAQQHGQPRWLDAATRTRPYDHRRDIALGDGAPAASLATRRLVGRVSRPDVAARRRANYDRLFADLGGFVPAAFRVVPDGASPMAFPILVGNKARALAALDRHGVAGLDLWSVAHPSMPNDGFDVERELRGRVVGLPVHQELRPHHLDLIVDAAERALAS